MVEVTNGAALAIQLAILLLAALSLGFSLWAAREGSPVLAILGRWLRWVFLTMLVAGATYIFKWSPYGFGTLFLVSMLVIFLVETGYNWVAISALSKSQLPLFPRFEENERGEEWPSMPAFIRLREWLRWMETQGPAASGPGTACAPVPCCRSATRISATGPPRGASSWWPTAWRPGWS